MDLSEYREQFPIAEKYAYLNHASIASPSSRVSSGVQAHIQKTQEVPFTELLDPLMKLDGELRTRVKKLINAYRADEIVPMPNTTTGINTVANSLPLRTGDNVLVLDGDYPANIYPWMNLAPRGVLTKIVPASNGGLDIDLLQSRIDSHTRAICISTVMFSTGFRNDLGSVGKLCRERNIYFIVDGIQSLGALPLDVQALRIDFLACGSQKWLLGMMGSGFLYCRHELLDRLQLGAYVGTLSVVDPIAYLDYNFTLQPSSERFNLAMPNPATLVALHESLGMLLEVGIERVRDRILSLTGTLINDMTNRGYTLISDTEDAHRSGIVTFELPDPDAASTKLKRGDVVTTVRSGRLRVSPHFYNSEGDVLRVGEVLGNV